MYRRKTSRIRKQAAIPPGAESVAVARANRAWASAPAWAYSAWCLPAGHGP
jgi:hypothetical protein